MIAAEEEFEIASFGVKFALKTSNGTGIMSAQYKKANAIK